MSSVVQEAPAPSVPFTVFVARSQLYSGMAFTVTLIFVPSGSGPPFLSVTFQLSGMAIMLLPQAAALVL